MDEIKVDTRGSRKALGAENARLKSKVGKLCIENNQLREEIEKLKKENKLMLIDKMYLVAQLKAAEKK